MTTWNSSPVHEKAMLVFLYIFLFVCFFLRKNVAYAGRQFDGWCKLVDEIMTYRLYPIWKSKLQRYKLDNIQSAHVTIKCNHFKIVIIAEPVRGCVIQLALWIINVAAYAYMLIYEVCAEMIQPLNIQENIAYHREMMSFLLWISVLVPLFFFKVFFQLVIKSRDFSTAIWTLEKKV